MFKGGIVWFEISLIPGSTPPLARWQNHGANNIGVKWPGGRVQLNSTAVFPLLKNDLTESERLAQQFVTAKTLVHETMVRSRDSLQF